MNVELTEAQTRFPTLIAKAAAGEDVVVTRNGTPVARIVRDSSSRIEVTPEQRAQAEEAVRDLARMATELKLGPFDIDAFKRDRNEDRR